DGSRERPPDWCPLCQAGPAPTDSRYAGSARTVPACLAPRTTTAPRPTPNTESATARTAPLGRVGDGGRRAPGAVPRLRRLGVRHRPGPPAERRRGDALATRPW